MDQFLRAESVHREGRTRQFGYRLKQLRGLHRLLLENQVQLLESLNTDRKTSEEATQSNYRTILNITAVEGTRLYEKYKKLEKQSLDITSSSSVLIIADSKDPLGSIVCPLTYAISAGSCAMISANKDNPALFLSLSAIFPRYLDREAYTLVKVPLETALKCDFRTVVCSGQPLADNLKQRTSVVQRQIGWNILCHADNTSNAISDCAAAMLYSKIHEGSPAAIDAILLLSSKMEAFKEHVTRLSLKTGNVAPQLREESVNYLKGVPTAMNGWPVLIAVSSTEDVLLHLHQLSVRRLTYFGDKSYGSYLLKFLPNISNGAVNTYQASEFYRDISTANFESIRTVKLAERPSLTIGEESFVEFPALKIEYTRSTPFFVQGLMVSNYVLYTSVGIACLLVAWKVGKVFL